MNETTSVDGCKSHTFFEFSSIWTIESTDVCKDRKRHSAPNLKTATRCLIKNLNGKERKANNTTNPKFRDEQNNMTKIGPQILQTVDRSDDQSGDGSDNAFEALRLWESIFRKLSFKSL